LEKFIKSFKYLFWKSLLEVIKNKKVLKIKLLKIILEKFIRSFKKLFWKSLSEVLKNYFGKVY